ncbi:MAG: hypothetical protein IJ191_05395, partial [Treponema sp.]|nr:hypothetical protein [Treponema sp.]
HDGDTTYEFSTDGMTLDLTYRGLTYGVIRTVKNVQRRWTGSATDTTQTTYDGVWTRLTNDDRYIQTMMTAYGWGGATWEYQAPRTKNNNE